MALLAVGAALAAALCYAVAAAVQQHQAAGAASAQARGWRLLSHLLRQPWWVAGFVAMLAGGGLHLIALSIGPLALVQPIGVCAVVFALPVAAALRRRRPQRGELTAAVLVVLGLSGLLLVVPLHAAPATSIGVTLILVAVAVTAAAVLVGLALGRQGRVRALLLAISAGVVFGTTSTVVHALLAAALHLQLLALVAVVGLIVGPLAVAGLLLTQHAYRAGGVAVVLATTTVTDPVTAITAGAVTLREGLPSDPTSLLLVGGAAVLVVWGITWLARSPVHLGAGHRADHESTNGSATDEEGHPAMTDDHAPTVAGIGEQLRSGPPRRILIGSDTYPPDVNGASYFTHRLAAGMAARGHDVTVLCPAHPEYPLVAVRDGVTVHRIPSIRIFVHPTFRICPPPAVNLDTAKVVL